MSASASDIRADFDRLALLDDGRWNHNSHYHDFLLRRLPAGRLAALEIGCGTGSFARALAQHFRHVVAIDLSPEMLQRARTRSQGIDNLEYHQADLCNYRLRADSFDCIAAIATLHHVPFEDTLSKLIAALRPGGVLLVLDLYTPRTLSDWILHGVALPTNLLLNVWKLGRLRQPPEIRQAWAEHGRRDVYPSIAEIRSAVQRVLPAAVVRRHLFWRYSLVWQKPVSEA
jgi:ubiquinone/menaquinone biosynthesis C-methylase UbiE